MVEWVNRFLRDFHNGIAIAFGFDSYYTDFKKSTFLYNKISSKFKVPPRQNLLTVLTLPTLLKTQCKCKIECRLSVVKKLKVPI